MGEKTRGQITELPGIVSSANHCLHLCHSSNQEDVLFPYLQEADAFVTADPRRWQPVFKENHIDCPIKKPRDVGLGEFIVVDGSSLGAEFERWEKKWEKRNRAICIYVLDEMEQSSLKRLVDVHDKMLLSTSTVRVLSDKRLEKEMEHLNPEIVETHLKQELKNVILSFLLSKPMCGTELVKALYQKFRVFVSPGMLYPALYELEKGGLLKYEYKLRNKVYSVQEEERAKHLLNNHARVNSMLSQFMVSNGGEPGEN